ncbi:uncharacterized protein LOC110825849 [Carica papaya]|uniref:uncharacterized protein LOC110825849 n=1 Tax=Carica papaya TaxID=3649 RepID=UPI000B8D006C|nr:uncharacterized protein LOC110825849 [Carica papaya]
MYRVQEKLSSYNEPNAVGNDESMATAAIALEKKRLTFVWLDGEAQQKYCFFYLHSETSYETCGPRRVVTDVPQLLIVRYMRNVTEDVKHEKKPKTIWQLQKEDVDSASQLVVSYNGSAEIPQIIKWISNMVEDGDSKDLPFYRTKTPELVPEDAEPVWSGESKTTSMKRKVSSISNRISDSLGDPRIGPALLLGALLYSGTIWWARSQPTGLDQSSQQSQSDTTDEPRERKRNRRRNLPKKDLPPSITDVEPKDAQQMPFLDSDSE